MDLEDLLNSVEGPDLEFKAAQGGLPGSLWETYSAFANTGGGVVILGVSEDNGKLSVLGVPNLARVRKSLFDCLNDRRKVSVSVLRDSAVEDLVVDGKRLLKITIPEADRRQKPVYINADIMNGTFRRIDSADYRCTEEVVRRMMAESLGSRDDRILPGFTIDDLDADSLSAYRNLFRSANPDHPWLGLDDPSFLRQLGGFRVDREARKGSPSPV